MEAGGARALIFPGEALGVYDLASLWREHTGLGFVFAMWMAHVDAGERIRAVDFAGARDEGLAHVEEIAAAYSDTLGLPLSELRAYLLENISFNLDAEMRAGLNLFYKLAHKHGIIPAVRPLRMLGQEDEPTNATGQYRER